MGFAQDINIQGHVADGDAQEAPLAFARVQVKGLDISTETALDGSFEMALLQGNYTFIIDFIGYKSVEVNGVVVTNDKIILQPVVLHSLKPTYDLVLAE